MSKPFPRSEGVLASPEALSDMARDFRACAAAWAAEPCSPECSHTQAEHEAFDLGLKAGGSGDEYPNPYETEPLRLAWESGNSVGLLNHRHEEKTPIELSHAWDRIIKRTKRQTMTPAPIIPPTLDDVLSAVRAEVERASALHAPYNSAHEGYAVILEELDELFDEVKANRGRAPEGIAEAVQVAATAIRYIMSLAKPGSLTIPAQEPDAITRLDAELQAEQTVFVEPDPGNFGHPNCNRVRQEKGLAYPRTCAECGLGPCKHPAPEPVYPDHYDKPPAELHGDLHPYWKAGYSVGFQKLPRVCPYKAGTSAFQVWQVGFDVGFKACPF